MRGAVAQVWVSAALTLATGVVMRPVLHCLPAAVGTAAVAAVGAAGCAVSHARSGRRWRGLATYYSDRLIGRPTASGEPYRAERMTAAHRTLPFGTKVRVTNLNNKRVVVVRINDRGPFGDRRRIIDVSRQAARRLGMLRAGVVPVSVELLARPGRR